jgi:hypothetical protein
MSYVVIELVSRPAVIRESLSEFQPQLSWLASVVQDEPTLARELRMLQRELSVLIAAVRDDLTPQEIIAILGHAEFWCRRVGKVQSLRHENELIELLAALPM